MLTVFVLAQGTRHSTSTVPGIGIYINKRSIACSRQYELPEYLLR